jgi:hypothetical protein
MSNLASERRKFPRYDREYTTQLISPDGDMVITALTSNISDGGMRIPLPSEALPECGLETQVKLTIPVSQTGDVENHVGLARIIRHTPEDEDGVAEIVLKFAEPMNLQLSGLI